MVSKANRERFMKHGVWHYPKPFSTRFEIPMDPRGKGRVRGIRPQGSKTLQTATKAFTAAPAASKGKMVFIPDNKTYKWETAFKNACKHFAPHKGILLGVLKLDILAVFDRPNYMLSKDWPDGLIWMGKTPDQDNIRKIVMDAMTMSKVFWNDDRQIVSGELRKVFRERDGEPRVIVRLQELTTQPVSADEWP